MFVEPDRGDAFLEGLNRSTDDYLPRHGVVRAVVFYCSADKALILEVIHITSAIGMTLLQMTPTLRRRRRDVAAKVRSDFAVPYRRVQPATTVQQESDAVWPILAASSTCLAT